MAQTASKQLGDKVLSVIGKGIRRGAVRVHLAVRERAGDNGGRSSEKYGAS